MWTQGFWYDMGRLEVSQSHEYRLSAETRFRLGDTVITGRWLEFDAKPSGTLLFALRMVPAGNFKISFQIRTSAQRQGVGRFKRALVKAKITRLGCISFGVGPVEDRRAYLNANTGTEGNADLGNLTKYPVRFGESGIVTVELDGTRRIESNSNIGIYVKYYGNQQLKEQNTNWVTFKCKLEGIWLVEPSNLLPAATMCLEADFADLPPSFEESHVV